jgi:hypothetical protein
MDLPELVAPGPDALGPATTDAVWPQPAAGEVVEEAGHRLGAPAVPGAEPIMQEVAPSGPRDILQAIERAQELSSLADARASVPSSGIPLVHEGERSGEPAAAPLAAGPAEEPQPIAPATALPSEVAAMREAVTERVAHELKRELSEKLLDRFEKIVWEVVPDLAEILITKEIERIRRLAEEEKSS